MNDTDQSLSSFGHLSTRQRGGLIMAAIAVVAGVSWAVTQSSGDADVVLPTDARLTSADIRELKVQFRKAGLSDFRALNNEIRVPSSQLGRYLAITGNNTQPNDWAAEWERQNAQLTPFSSRRARETGREIARAKLITGMLRQLPDIEQADVVWDEDEQPGWRQSPKARATVSLMPKSGRVLTLDVIRAVRFAVAGSKKNLDATDVVVMDLARQVTYEGALPSVAGEELLPSLRSLAETFRREIQSRVDGLDTADVSVSIDLPAFFAFLAQQTGNQTPTDSHNVAAQLSASASDLMRVDITLPADSTNDAPVTMIEKTATREQLTAAIARVTGIGRDADDDEAVIITFPPTITETPTSPADSGWALNTSGVALPSVTPRTLLNMTAGLFVALGGFLTFRRRSQRRRRERQLVTTTSGFPALHNVNNVVVNETNRTGDSFDDLVQFGSHDLQGRYAASTPTCWAVALRGSAHVIADRLYEQLDETTADELRRLVDQLGPVKLADIETSRRLILESTGAVHAPAA